MQVANSDQKGIPGGNFSENVENFKNSEKPEVLETNSGGEHANYDSVLDVSGRNLDLSVPKGSEDSIEGLYMYKNVFNLIPRWMGSVGNLKTLKFFGNEVNLFPTEFRNLVELECLQLKISTPSMTGLDFEKLKALKELELCKVPPRPSAFPLLSEIAGLKCLTKLSVCHFSIRYLPPEIGWLKNLEFLDLSFNKMRSLPNEITYLIALISFKVANNKLVEVPSGLSSLQRLEILDLSNNRLASVECLKLGSMHNLRKLYLQYNKLLSYCQIPSWISCNLEGNEKDTSIDELFSSAVEMDVFEDSAQGNDDPISPKGFPVASSSHVTGSSSSSRCFATRWSRKGWNRKYYLQQRARQERLNNSMKWKVEDPVELSTQKAAANCKPCKHVVLVPESQVEGSSVIPGPDSNNKEGKSGKTVCEITSVDNNDISSKNEYEVDYCACVLVNSVDIRKGGEKYCTECDASLDSISDGAQLQDECSSSALCNSALNSKRHPDRDLDNPKPSKSRRPIDDYSNLSSRYSNTSFCSIDDHLPDGFYDAGRDRPFMPLSSYEQTLHLDSREVILLDREKDEELDAIALCAQALMSHFKQSSGSTKERGHFAIGNLQIASLLALFVSDHFGGSDRSGFLVKMRKVVSGSNYRKPFVCTCPTGSSDGIRKPSKQGSDSIEDIVFPDLCEKSLQSAKARQKSIVVPIGILQFGVCRHRALLMKYLCDRMEPHVPCELIRGYFDFSPHAWNIVIIKRNGEWARMIVDACHPHDMREETDPEYFCRYIPLSWISVPNVTDSIAGPNYSFPSLSACDEIEKEASSTLIRCEVGSVEAIAKVRTLEIGGISTEEIRNFEYSCLGEVRILRALNKHSCIVEMYGHQISSKWARSLDGDSEQRILHSAILMEYIKGGSLKNYVEKLSRAGGKHVRMDLALHIARDVACALVEMHSKHIIHRDIKSENILVDLDRRRPDGTPVVKLCDFDRAVPLRSSLHSCCIAHLGVPPPNVCVGTPRWMAPEVFRAMNKPDMYGLEVDIWSFGCLLLELLTLQVPYSGLSESEIHDLLQRGKRPPLTDELEEVLCSRDDPAMAQSSAESRIPEGELEIMKFLVNLCNKCTENNPTDRPTADSLYDMLLSRTNSLFDSRSLDREE